jgi:hypothetical protein
VKSRCSTSTGATGHHTRRISTSPTFGAIFMIYRFIGVILIVIVEVGDAHGSCVHVRSRHVVEAEVMQCQDDVVSLLEAKIEQLPRMYFGDFTPSALDLVRYEHGILLRVNVRRFRAINELNSSRPSLGPWRTDLHMLIYEVMFWDVQDYQRFLRVKEKGRLVQNYFYRSSVATCNSFRSGDLIYFEEDPPCCELPLRTTSCVLDMPIVVPVRTFSKSDIVDP